MINTRTAKAIAVIGLGAAIATMLRHRAVAAVEKRYSGHFDDDVVDALVVEDEMDDIVDALVADEEDGDATSSPLGKGVNPSRLAQTIVGKDDARGNRTYIYSEPFQLDESEVINPER